MGELEEGAHVKTDMGCISSAPKYATCPDAIWTEVDKEPSTSQASNGKFENGKLEYPWCAIHARCVLCEHQNIFSLLSCSSSLSFKMASPSLT